MVGIGGAGSNKYGENNTFASLETLACQYRIQVMTGVILETLEDSLGINPEFVP